MDFEGFLRSKLDAFKNSVNQATAPIGQDITQGYNALNNLGNTLSQPVVNLPQTIQQQWNTSPLNNNSPAGQAYNQQAIQNTQWDPRGSMPNPNSLPGIIGNTIFSSGPEAATQLSQDIPKLIKVPGAVANTAKQIPPVLNNVGRFLAPQADLQAGMARIPGKITNENLIQEAKNITTPPLSPTEGGVLPQAQNDVNSVISGSRGVRVKNVPNSKLSPESTNFLQSLETDKNLTPEQFSSKYPNVPPVKNPKAVNTLEQGQLPLPQQIISNGPKEPTIPLKQAATNAISELTGYKQTARVGGETTAEVVKNTVKTPEETALFRNSIEHPENVVANAAKTSNPDKFTNAVQSFRNFTDTIHQQYNSVPSNDKLGYLKDFYSHILDLSDPATKLKYDAFVASKFKNSAGYFTKTRIFKNIDELQEAGFKLKNNTVPEDIMQYTGSVSRSGGANAFVAEIAKTHPNEIATNVSSIPRDATGKPFVQLKIPGLEGTFVSPELYSHVKNMEPSGLSDVPLVKAFDKVNSTVKSVQLGLGGFHAFKTTMRQVVNNPLIIPRALLNSVSPEARLTFRQSAIRDGVVDAAGKMNVTLGKSDNLIQGTSIGEKILSKNPLDKFNQGLFGGLIDTYKLDAVRQAMKRFDLTNPEQLKQARDYGAQINNLFGGLNYDVMGRNKTVQQILRAVTLAPDFNEGKIRQILTSADLRDWSPGAIFARKNLIGEAVVAGIIAEVGRKLTTGNFDNNFKDIIQHAVLNPSFPLPSQFNNPKNNKPQQAGVPGSDISDIYRATQDPVTFLQARGSAGVGLGTKLVSGKDYYGNSLVNPWNGTQDNMVNRVKALVPNEAPIPVVQAEKLAQGRISLPTAALNTAGFRVSNDQSTPQATTTKAYFDGIATVAKTLNPNDQQIFMGLLHPTTKDPEGNPVVTNTPLTKPTQYEALLNNPKILAAEQTFQQSQPGHSPMWDQTPAVLRQYLQYEVLNKTAPGSAEEKQYLKNHQAVLPVIQAHSQWGANLSSTLNLPQSGLTPPVASPYVQQQLNTPKPNYNDPQVSSYMAQHLDYVNAQRLSMGLDPLDKYGNIQGSKNYGVTFGSGSSYKGRMPFSLKSQFTKSRHMTIKKVQLKIHKPKALKLVKYSHKKIHIAKPHNSFDTIRV